MGSVGSNVSLLTVGILFKESNSYCKGSASVREGGMTKFDRWDRVYGDPDVLCGMNSRIGLISPRDFSSFSWEKSKHWRSG